MSIKQPALSKAKGWPKEANRRNVNAPPKNNTASTQSKVKGAKGKYVKKPVIWEKKEQGGQSIFPKASNTNQPLSPLLLKYGADFDMPGAYGKTARKLLDGDFGKKLSNELKAIIRDFQCQTQQDVKDNNYAVYINVDKEGFLSNSGQLVAQNGLFKSNIEQKSSELSSVVNNNKLPSEKYLVINFASISEDKKSEILKFLSEKGIQTSFIDAEKIPEVPRYQVVK